MPDAARAHQPARQNGIALARDGRQARTRMNSSIRRMTASDHAAARRLWREAGMSDEPEDSLEDVKRLLAAPQAAGFVAVGADGVVGGVALCGSDGRYGYIHHLAVAESARGRGVGRELVDACTRFLSTRHVIVMVRDSNEPARAFWQRLGYTEAEGLRIGYQRFDRR